ncbi:MAG: glycosyltransferase 87 family protein [Promethearchaeota archaeon]
MNRDNNDYLSFYNAGLIVLEDLPRLYDSSLYLFPFRYFPLSAYFFTPFSLLGLEAGYFIFQMFNFFLNIVNLYLIFKIIQIYMDLSSDLNLEYELSSPKDIFFKPKNESILHQYAVLLIILPQFMNYFLGQINILVSFFILSSLLYFLKGGYRNDFLGGFLLGFGILIKPTLILILPFIIVLNYNRNMKKSSLKLKQSIIRLGGSIILIGLSGLFFLVYPNMLSDFIEVNLAGDYTYNVSGLEINPSFSLTRVLLILFGLVELDINGFLVFGIITLLFLVPLYYLFIVSPNQTTKLIYGYLAGITITLIVYFDSWPHHLVVLAPFLVIFLILNKDFERYTFFKYLHYLIAILMVIFWGIFYLTYMIIPVNIGGLVLIILLYYNLIVYYKTRSL